MKEKLKNILLTILEFGVLILLTVMLIFWVVVVSLGIKSAFIAEDECSQLRSDVMWLEKQYELLNSRQGNLDKEVFGTLPRRIKSLEDVSVN